MPKSEKGDNSAKYLQNFAKINQVIYTVDTICEPNIMILAKMILQIFCWQGSIGLQSRSQKRGTTLQWQVRQKRKPEDHWSCIAHLSAEDMLKSVVIEEKKFKHSPWVGADNPLGPKFWCQQEGLITMVICCKFKKNLFNLWIYTHLFMI